MDQFEYRYAAACAQIEDFDSLGRFLFEHAVHGNHVSLGQVDHVDVVANARPVGRVIVVAEYAQLLADTDSRLGEVGNEVLGNTVGQLADFGTGVSSDGVEVAEDNRFERSVGVERVFDNLLADLFRVAVGRQGRFDGCRFVDRQHVGLAVDRARRREDDALYAKLGHEREQIDERQQVVAVVEQRFLYRFAHCLAGCEVDNTLDARVILEELAQRLDVGTVGLYESGAHARDAFDAIEHLDVRVGQIVDDNNFVACVLQFYGRVGADVTRSPGNQNLSFHDDRCVFYLF